MNKFEEELDQIDWSDVLLTDDLESSCESFIGTINKMKEKFTKTFKNRCIKNNLPWFNEQLWDLRDQVMMDKFLKNLRNKVVN